MAFILKARCPACSYGEESISVGDYSMIAGCTACKSLANPKAIPFRYDNPPCEKCGASLNEKDFVAPGSLRCGWEWAPSELACPRCKSGVLELSIALHLNLIFREHCPNLGAEIHGCYERYHSSKHESGPPGFRVPGLWLMRGKVQILNDPPREAGRRMVLRVVGLEHEGESVKNLTLRFERWLE